MSDQYRIDESDGTSALRVSVENRKQVLTRPADKSNVTVSGGQTYFSPWISCIGYDRVAITAQYYNQVTKGIVCSIDFSHDGINQAGNSQTIGTGSAGVIAKETPILAGYFRVEATNSDTSPRQLDIWGLLKP